MEIKCDICYGKKKIPTTGSAMYWPERFPDDFKPCPKCNNQLTQTDIEGYMPSKGDNGMIQHLDNEIALKSIINHALHVFPKSFINHSNEIILEPRNNVYFRLDEVRTELDFKCKMFAWLSRPIAKELNKYWAPRVLESLNDLLRTNFTKDDMYLIYDRLGNDVNRTLTIQFIESNYDLALLERKEADLLESNRNA